MTEEKPLHVRVAEALGCMVKLRKAYEGDADGTWCCEDGHHRDPNRHEPWEDDPEIAGYDTDWAATGPLIEKYKINMAAPELPQAPNWQVGIFDKQDRVSRNGDGETPLIAVCNLILKLKEAGKLEKS